MIDRNRPAASPNAEATCPRYDSRHSRGRACSAASLQALAGRRLALSRVHPPPGDGSAPHARLSRLPGLQCTPVASRCRSRRRGAHQWLGSCGGARRASRHRYRPSTCSAAPTRPRDLHGVGALCNILVAAPAASFTVGCRATARRWCCARVRLLLLGVARTTSWSWLVSLAPRGGAQEDRQGREVARNIWWGRMAIYYESAKSRTLRARCARLVLDSDQSELAHARTVYRTPLSRELERHSANLEVVA